MDYMDYNVIDKKNRIIEILKEERSVMSLQEYRKIVQSNEITDLPAKRMNANEINIFACLCYKLQNKKTNVIELTFDEIRKLINYKQTDNGRLADDIETMNNKLMELKIKQKNDKRTLQFVFFPTFMVDREYKCLTVAINPIFEYMLNELEDNFTIMDLTQLVLLRSTYSKNLYKKLCKFKSTGVYETSIEDFVEYMDIPNSYTISKIDSVVLKMSLKELQNYFENLKCEKKYKRNGRGRPSVIGYIFTFTPKLNKSYKKIVHEDKSEMVNEKKYILSVRDKFLLNQNKTITLSNEKLKVEDVKKKVANLSNEELEYIQDLYLKSDIKKNPDAYIISLMYNLDNEKFANWKKQKAVIEKKENNLEIKNYYKKTREKNKSKLEKHRKEVYAICPEIEELENRKRRIRAEGVKHILTDSDEGNRLRSEADKITMDIKSMLKINGFAEDYIDSIYSCKKCKDTGVLDIGIQCNCYKK